MDKPSVSVIVPVYNDELFIGKCIEALLNQDYPRNRMEILIVDNNSKDDSPTIIYKYPVRYLKQDKIQSSYASRNMAIRQAAGEICAFTDADCVPDRSWITELVNGMSNKEMGCAGEIDEPRPTNIIEHYHSGRYSQATNMGGQNKFAATANVAYRREVFTKIGLFREDFVSGGDADFSWRLQEAGYVLGFNPKARVLHLFKPTYERQWKQAKRYAFGMICLSEYHPHLRPRREKIYAEITSRTAGWLGKILYRTVTVPFKDNKQFYFVEPFLRLREEWATFWGIRMGLRHLKNKENNIAKPFD